MNEKFAIVIETLEAAEKEMSELHNVMEYLEQRMEASWHETQTIADYRKRLAVMGQVVRSMLAKRESALLEKVRAEHRVRLTGGSLRDLQALSTPQHLSGLKADSNPPASR